MASDAILGLRTVTRAALYRQAIVSGSPALIPIAMATNPSEITIDSGEDIQELEETGCDGAKEIAFSYADGRKPELNMTFATATIDLEAAIFGRVAKTVPSGTEIYAFSEFNTEFSPTTARATGTLGQTVTAQAANGKATAWYIDPATKIAKQVTVIASTGTPEDDEITIGAGFVITCSPELIAKKVNLKVWCPCVIADAVGISNEPITQFTVRALGVSFDGKARFIQVRNLSRLGGAQTGSNPERSLKLRINPDSSSISGLGYDVIDLSVAMAC
jgi:hypothetical protein